VTGTLSLPDINFDSIREHNGTRAHGFEELCCQLASLEPCSEGAEHYRKGRGADAGVECFTRFPNGRETGWQVKYYWKMDSSLTGSLDDSIEKALAKHPKLDTYIVCIPFDLPDPRTGKKPSDIEKWQTWRDKWITEAGKTGRSLTIELWNASVLKERLTREDPLRAGRILFWFNKQPLTQDWFRRKFGSVKEDLGSRYTSVTNVKLPIRRALLGLARDPALRADVETWINEIARAGTRAVGAAHRLGPHARAAMPKGLEKALKALETALSAPLPGIAQDFPLASWGSSLDTAAKTVGAVFAWSLKDPAEFSEESRENQSIARHHLWKLRDALANVQSSLQDDLWRLVNHRRVLVCGDGGIGKSHLLADVASHQIERGRPAILLLGQHFVDNDPWRQIICRLELPPGTTTDQFLGALDAASQAAGVRGLVLIDALNEKHGPHLWHDRLAGFLEKLKSYPHLAVIMSCRTTYLRHVVPETLLEDRDILPHLHHQGFGSNDTRAYLAMRNIVLPGAPVPSPGFENPLLLKTCCDALERKGKRVFPRGLRGTTEIFEFYRNAVAGQINRRLGLDERRRIVPYAIDALAKEMAESANEYVSVATIHGLFDAILPSQASQDRDLLFQLESEGLLTVEPTENDVNGSEEKVRFTFQRFSDHSIADHLLKKYLAPENPAAAFAVEGALHPFVNGPNAWKLAGVVEALAVQLPERTDAELPDLVPKNSLFGISEAFRKSLLWRAQESFTERTLELVREILGEHEVLPTLLHTATEPENRFNALYLHEKLAAMPLPLPLPLRDAQWSIPIAELGTDEQSPVWTLINWAWSSELEVIEDEEHRTELAGITLAWFLTTTHRAVRDRATKALATLLAPRPRLAVDLLRRFWQVDDDYLRERLLAAIYGALLQGQAKLTDVGAVALAVYRTLFEHDAPPANALLRDHGRCIIEYALHLNCLPVDVDPEKARPPYRSSWPLEIVPDAVIDAYQRVDRSGVRLPDKIVSSCVNDGDFARYVIDIHVGNWSLAPLGTQTLPTDEQIRNGWLADFLASASPEAKDAFSHLEEQRKKVSSQPARAKTPERQAYAEAKEAFRATLSSEAWEDYRTRAGGWSSDGMFNYGGDGSFDLAWARRWVCKRAHDLGWSEELHSKFDNGQFLSQVTSHAIERIGKKYQWLALYELGARLADNCAFTCGRSEDGSPGYYDGESFGSLRNLDPSLLVRESHDSGWTEFREPSWWSPILPRLNQATPEERLHWLYDNERDRIDGNGYIDVTDRNGRRWLVLHNSSSVHERSHGSSGTERKTWSRVSCCVVRKKDLKGLLDGIGTMQLTDPDARPKITLYGRSFYFGEYPWHPALSDLPDWVEPKSGFRCLSVAARPTVTEYSYERGGFDYSLEETVHIALPAPWLIRAMDLRRCDGRRAAYVDEIGRIQFFDPCLSEEGPHAGLVDRDAFLNSLDRQDLVAVWLIAGEKGVYGNSGSSFGGQHAFTSLYWMEDDRWKHRLAHSAFKAPALDQVQRLFKGPIPSWVKTRKPNNTPPGA
jgi:hypothetical protein